MNIDVSNKVVVITGSSRGIGKGIAELFAKENAKVVINYNKSYESAKSLFESIKKYNSNCLLYRADITSVQDVSNMHKAILQQFGKIDVLINNAGICRDRALVNMPVDYWKEVLDVNLTGTYICCKEFSKSMIKQKYGKIINISSIKGQTGSEHQANYSASKAGVNSLTKTLAKELGKYNILVNSICPGFILTDLNKNNSIKIKNALENSILNIDNSLNDLLNFLLFISSDNMLGVSGRTFNLDSRL